MSIAQAKATLRLRSDTATAAQVTHRLGLVPSFSAERGEPITPRHPTQLRDCSVWGLDSRLADYQPLHHLADLLHQLAGKHQVLTELAVSYEIDWFCLAGTDNPQGSVELPHELIARLAAIPGDLVLDIYTGEDQPDLNLTRTTLPAAALAALATFQARRSGSCDGGKSRCVTVVPANDHS